MEYSTDKAYGEASDVVSCGTTDHTLTCGCVDCPAACPHGGGNKHHSDYYQGLSQSLGIYIDVLNCHLLLFPFIVGVVYLAFLIILLLISMITPQLKCLSDDEESNEELSVRGEKKERYTFMYQTFYKLGLKVAKYPWHFIIVSCVIVGISAIGFVNFSIEMNPVKLWVPESSTLLYQKKEFDKLFEPFFRVTQAIITREEPYASQYDNIFYNDILLKLSDLQKKIEKVNATINGEVYGWSDLCFRPTGIKHGCYRGSVTEYFVKQNFVLDNNTSHEDIEGVIQTCAQNPSGDYCLGSNHILTFPFIVLGGYQGENYTTTNSLVLTYLMNNYPSNLHASLVWEEQVKEILQSTHWPGYHISYSVERSVGDELARMSSTDIPTVALSYLAMFLYVSLALGSLFPCDRYIFQRTRFFLGFCSIMIVLFSIILSMGICSVFNVKATLIIGEVIPFLVLAIGIDNVFIILNTFSSKNPNLSIEIRLAETLAQVGTSITLASLSEGFSFFLGILTRMPAVRAFAVYAAVAIIADFLLQITCFAAFLVIDTKRKEKGYLDILPCVKIEDMRERKTSRAVSEEFEVNLEKSTILFDSQLSLKDSKIQYLFHLYVPFLLNPLIKVLVVLLFVGMSLLSLSYGFQNIQLGLEKEVALPFDSYLKDYFHDLNTYLMAGVPVFFVINTMPSEGTWEDYQNYQKLCTLPQCNKDSMLTIIQQASNIPERTYIQTASNSWLDDYLLWLMKPKPCCRIYKDQEPLQYCPPPDQGGPSSHSSLCKRCIHDPSTQTINNTWPTSDVFREFLPWFLYNSSSSKDCSVSGLPYGKYINTDDDNHITSFRFMTYHTVLRNEHDYIQSLATIVDMDTYISNRNDISLFSYAVFDVFFEQYLYIVNVAILNIILSSCIIFLLSLILLRNLWISLIAVVTVGMILIDLIGIMSIWDIKLNAVSVVNLVMCIGISVEFCIHIMVYFMRSYGTRDDRVKTAMINIGSSIFSGIFLTKFVGVIVLALAPSAIFQIYYFRMYLSICLLGGSHCFFFLPVVLSLLGPRPLISPMKPSGLFAYCFDDIWSSDVARAPSYIDMKSESNMGSPLILNNHYEDEL